MQFGTSGLLVGSFLCLLKFSSWSPFLPKVAQLHARILSFLPSLVFVFRNNFDHLKTSFFAVAGKNGSLNNMIALAWIIFAGVVAVTPPFFSLSYLCSSACLIFCAFCYSRTSRPSRPWHPGSSSPVSFCFLLSISCKSCPTQDSYCTHSIWDYLPSNAYVRVFDWRIVREKKMEREVLKGWENYEGKFV